MSADGAVADSAPGLHDRGDSGCAGRVRVEGARVVERLRTLSPQRLGRAHEDGVSPAERAHQVAQRLADLAADAAGRPRRPVPRLPDLCAGDQLAVLVADVLADRDELAVAGAADELTALRRAL